jgi:CRISPR-associated endonuclease Cas1
VGASAPEGFSSGGVVSHGRWVEVEAGVPQGAVISPLLSNIYLHPFDQEMTKAGYALVRYGDDCLVLSPTRDAATQALKTATTILQQVRLRLNPEADLITHVNTGFVFLGFLFKGNQKMIAPGKLQQMQQRLRTLLQDLADAKLNRVVNELNETLSGWRRYYGLGTVTDQFQFLETVLIDQLAVLLERQRAAGLIKNSEDARPALQRIEWLTERDLEAEQRLVDRIFERLRRRQAAAQKSKNRRQKAEQTAEGGEQKAEGSRETEPGMPPPVPVAKAVARKRREVEKRLSAEAELVISERGSFVGKTKRRIVVREKGKTVKEIPLFRLKTITLVSRGISLSTDLVQYCANEGIPIHFIDFDGRPYAHLVGPRFPLFNLTKAQAEAARGQLGLELAAAFVEGKIRNQINLIKYYCRSGRHRDAVFDAHCDMAITKMQALLDQIETILADENIEQARGRLFALEGHSASHYWTLIKTLLSADVYFSGRERRGATDLVNSLLNYGYGILYGRVYEAIILAGLNPNIGFLHAERAGKPTLVFDLVEEFRQPVVDKVVIAMIRRKVKLNMEGTRLTHETKLKVVDAVIGRLNTRVRYRSERVLLREVIHRQAKALARALEGKGRYRPFIDQW